jgi:hypothetical protein
VMVAQAQKYEPLCDIDPETGISIEVFYADRTLETFGRGGAGWFWWPRLSGFSPSYWAFCYQLRCISARDDRSRPMVR